MAEEINFLDLAALSKIGPDTVVERYGSLINSSFFDASNILGTLKLKGLIDFSTIFAGQNAIKVTDSGKQLLVDAAAKASSSFDELDFAIITQLSSSKRTLSELTKTVNLRPTDLALHVYKLVQQQYLSYTIRNGNLDLTLTEKGFLQAKAGMPNSQPSQEQGATAAQGPNAAKVDAQPQNASQAALQGDSAAMPEAEAVAQDTSSFKPKKRRSKMVAVVAVVIILIIALLALRQLGLLATVGL